MGGIGPCSQFGHIQDILWTHLTGYDATLMQSGHTLDTNRVIYVGAHEGKELDELCR